MSPKHITVARNTQNQENSEFYQLDKQIHYKHFIQSLCHHFKHTHTHTNARESTHTNLALCSFVYCVVEWICTGLQPWAYINYKCKCMSTALPTALCLCQYLSASLSEGLRVHSVLEIVAYLFLVLGFCNIGQLLSP